MTFYVFKMTYQTVVKSLQQKFSLVAYFLVSAFLSKMFDIGDLPVLTSGC